MFKRKPQLALLLSLMMLSGMVACNGQNATPGTTMTNPESIADIIERESLVLMANPGVTGMAESLCDGQPCIKVYLEQDDPELINKIPGSYSGVPVVIEISGRIVKQ